MSSIKECYLSWTNRLRQAGIEAPGFELDLLLETFCFVSKKDRLLDPERELDQEKLEQMQMVLSRREEGEPLQYLLGWWEFYGRRFSVGPGVFIPRADTERLVEEALKELKSVSSPRIADLCAGSGCIGLTVACERPDAQVSLLELSPQAMDYCKKNRDVLAPRCMVSQADVLKDTAGLEQLDAVLSNPPYIPSAELCTLQREVRKEPCMALDGSADGLRFYREIPALWKKTIKPGGLLLLEIGFDQAMPVCDLLKEAGFEEIRVAKDYGGNDRVISAHKPW